MPKHDEQHLTTIQLSALLDKQLPEEELAICNAHLQSCQQCQAALAALKQTVGLLQALPEPAMPRSFVLPKGVTYLQERPARQEEQQARINEPAPVRRHLWPYYVRRSLRAVSTIAAVIGLFFLLSGVLPLLSHGGSATSTSAPAPVSKNVSVSGATNTSGGATATAQRAINNGQHEIPPKAGQTPGTAVNTPSTVLQPHNQNTASQPQPPLPIPDLSTPVGRQELGFTLLVLGIIGALLTRRRQTSR